jgi:glycerophosphoryl diester phosphodiesterase
MSSTKTCARVLPGNAILYFLFPTSADCISSLPECWGHRGVGYDRGSKHPLALLTMSTQASAAYPENTLSSFEAAIRDGAEGIESGILYRG